MGFLIYRDFFFSFFFFLFFPFHGFGLLLSVELPLVYLCVFGFQLVPKSFVNVLSLPDRVEVVFVEVAVSKILFLENQVVVTLSFSLVTFG